MAQCSFICLFDESNLFIDLIQHPLGDGQSLLGPLLIAVFQIGFILHQCVKTLPNRAEGSNPPLRNDGNP